jgi:hypothetical protein
VSSNGTTWTVASNPTNPFRGPGLTSLTSARIFDNGTNLIVAASFDNQAWSTPDDGVTWFPVAKPSVTGNPYFFGDKLLFADSGQSAYGPDHNVATEFQLPLLMPKGDLDMNDYLYAAFKLIKVA